MSRLILASTSPYRRELLERLGLPFETRSSRVDEHEQPGETPAAMAARLAAAKATAVAAKLAVVIGADQAAAIGGQVLRKPGDHPTALRQLLACQGKDVVFHTAVMVIDHRSGQIRQHTDQTLVRFAALSEAQLDRYLVRERPYDCAGGFKAEGLGVSLFEAIETRDPTALIGLPLIWLSRTLRALGLDPLAG